MSRIFLISVVFLASCAPTTTTLRFVDNREAVAVNNPEKPKAGDRLEALIGTRKKVFFYVTRNSTLVSFHPSIDPEPGRKKLVAELSIDTHSVRFFVVQLRQSLPFVGSPTPSNQQIICNEPTVAHILGGARTEIVGVGKGSWLGTQSSSNRLFLRPFDPDLLMVVDTGSLDLARARDFVLRMGSLTFERN
jgi:hypothetical protein